MPRPASEETPSRASVWKFFALGASVAVLALVAGFAVVREWRAPRQPVQPSAAAAFTAGLSMQDARGLSVEEETYAATLWPIHSEVKLLAVRMIFAGIDYKTKSADAAKLKAAVEPLTGSFQAAAQRARKIEPPASFKAEHDTYLRALELYAAASREMIKVALDGRDEHLVNAHQRSAAASVELLKLSDALWPGEYKPN
jgi:hypothetical protein